MGGTKLTWLGVIREIRLQVVLLTCILLLYALSAADVIPLPGELRERLRDFFSTYGILAVAPIAFLENLAGFNVYFPGSIAILTAMAFTSGDPEYGLRTFSAIVGSASVAHQINFVIGRRFGSRSLRFGRLPIVPEQRLKRLRWLAFVATLWHPHFAAVTCMQAGALGMPYGRFLAMFVPVFFLWNMAWGLTMFIAGGVLTSREGVFPFMIVYIVIWLLWDLLRLRRAISLLERTDRNANRPT